MPIRANIIHILVVNMLKNFRIFVGGVVLGSELQVLSLRSSRFEGSAKRMILSIFPMSPESTCQTKSCWYSVSLLLYGYYYCYGHFKVEC